MGEQCDTQNSYFYRIMTEFSRNVIATDDYKGELNSKHRPFQKNARESMTGCIYTRASPSVGVSRVTN